MPQGERIVKLISELEAMPEYNVLLRIKALDRSRYIYTRNYSELRKLLEFYSDLEKSLPLWDRKNRDKQEAFHYEVTRLLHNFVASGRSLVDHTRTIYQSLYRSSKQFPEYQKKVDSSFTHNAVAQFVESLRNYCQHYKTPPVFSEMRYEKDPPLHVSRIKLDVNALKEFSDWKRESRKYLAGQTSDIDLLDIIGEYHNLVIEFHDWFVKRQKEIHYEDIQKVNSKKKELAALVIPDEVKYALADIQSGSRGIDDAFAVMLTPQQRAELATIPISLPGYSEKLISFIEEWTPLDEGLKKRVRDVCK